mmetsp:Transcript_44633/g.140856  ORF Transcript_44633/g.140856 Transcript_44633/m.140856 type:complete len:146 (+) Transcript_44633:637-1074(+)
MTAANLVQEKTMKEVEMGKSAEQGRCGGGREQGGAFETRTEVTVYGEGRRMTRRSQRNGSLIARERGKGRRVGRAWMLEWTVLGGCASRKMTRGKMREMEGEDGEKTTDFDEGRKRGGKSGGSRRSCADLRGEKKMTLKGNLKEK